MENKYYSYLLRLWKSEQIENAVTWRASLESTDSTERIIFSDIGELVEYINHLTSEPPPSIKVD
jgi:hypothetical protein